MSGARKFPVLHIGILWGVDVGPKFCGDSDRNSVGYIQRKFQDHCATTSGPRCVDEWGLKLCNFKLRQIWVACLCVSRHAWNRRCTVWFGKGMGFQRFLPPSLVRSLHNLNAEDLPDQQHFDRSSWQAIISRQLLPISIAPTFRHPILLFSTLPPSSQTPPAHLLPQICQPVVFPHHPPRRATTHLPLK